MSSVDVDTIDLKLTMQRVGKMVQYETRGFGDDVSALQRICKRYELPFWTIDRILKGNAKDARGGIIRRVRLAYYAYCENLLERIEADLQNDKAVYANDGFDDFVAAAEGLAVEAEGLAEKARSRREQIERGG